jgi:hypothetical protein
MLCGNPVFTDNININFQISMAVSVHAVVCWVVTLGITLEGYQSCGAIHGILLSAPPNGKKLLSNGKTDTLSKDHTSICGL